MFFSNICEKSHLLLKETILLLIVAGLVFVFRLPSILEPLDNDSGAIAYHARQILRGEPLYGTHHTGHHMPGVYYTYALSFLLFGDHATSPKWLLIPWVMINTWIIYQIGRMLSRFSGILAAVIFAILSTHMLLKGMTGEPELFANLPISVGIWIALKLTQSSNKIRPWFWVGFLGAIAFLYKAIYLTPLIVGGALTLSSDFKLARQEDKYKGTLLRFFWASVGLVIPLLGAVLFFGFQRNLNSFLDVFGYGFRYMRELPSQLSDISLPLYIFFPVLMLTVNNAAVLILALGGSLRLMRKLSSLSYKESLLAIGLLTWFGISLLLAGLSGIGFAHYVLLVTPPVSLLAAMEIAALKENFSRRGSVIWGQLFTGLLVAVVLINSVLVNGAVYRDFIAYSLGKISYTDYLTRHVGTGKVHLKVSKLATYIRERTNPEDKIYYWGDSMQLYYLADRQCALDIIWPYYADLRQPYKQIFGPQTPYIIVAQTMLFDPPQWLYEELNKAYILETTIEGEEIYRYREK